jgi:cytochrome c peroxidase
LTPAKIDLGREIFFDARPSAESRVSRSSWRDAKFALTDGRAASEEVWKRLGPRKTPTALIAEDSEAGRQNDQQ